MQNDSESEHQVTRDALKESQVGAEMQLHQHLERLEDEIAEMTTNEINEKNSISDEIIKLNQLKKDGLLTEEEYLKAKEKLLS